MSRSVSVQTAEVAYCRLRDLIATGAPVALLLPARERLVDAASCAAAEATSVRQRLFWRALAEHARREVRVDVPRGVAHPVYES